MKPPRRSPIAARPTRAALWRSVSPVTRTSSRERRRRSPSGVFETVGLDGFAEGGPQRSIPALARPDETGGREPADFPFPLAHDGRTGSAVGIRRDVSRPQGLSDLRDRDLVGNRDARHGRLRGRRPPHRVGPCGRQCRDRRRGHLRLVPDRDRHLVLRGRRGGRGIPSNTRRGNGGTGWSQRLPAPHRGAACHDRSQADRLILKQQTPQLVRPAIPLRIREAASRTMIAAATVRAFRSSHPRTATSSRSARWRATISSKIATASGSSETTVKKTQFTMYSVALGSSSEMFLRAIGMNAPGFARAAPAPTIAMTGEDATFCICVIMLADLVGFGGFLSVLTTNASSRAPATTSKIETHVLGLLGVGSAAESPSTNAATIPIPSVAPNAPM